MQAFLQLLCAQHALHPHMLNPNLCRLAAAAFGCLVPDVAWAPGPGDPRERDRTHRLASPENARARPNRRSAQAAFRGVALQEGSQWQEGGSLG